MDPSLDLVEHFKLETDFLPDVTEHTTYKSDRDLGVRRVKVTKRWARKKDLGEGAFGIVWLETEDDGSERAVKEISKRMCSRNSIDYNKELAAMAKLSKRGDLFVELFGWFEDTDHIFLAMEYCRLGDLEQYMRDAIPEAQIKVITAQLLEGLKTMHHHAFTHRDLKPKNIFVVKEHPVWWVKIGDFGISKRIVNDRTFLRTEIGTREYLAPEVLGYVDEESSRYTNAVDLWSLGCICHRLLTKQLPFAKLTLLAPYCWGKSQLPIESSRNPILTPEAVRFVKNLMAPEPSERLSAEEALQSPWFQGVEYLGVSTAEHTKIGQPKFLQTAESYCEGEESTMKVTDGRADDTALSRRSVITFKKQSRDMDNEPSRGHATLGEGKEIAQASPELLTLSGKPGADQHCPKPITEFGSVDLLEVSNTPTLPITSPQHCAPKISLGKTSCKLQKHLELAKRRTTDFCSVLN